MKGLVGIGEAASALGVSITTLRRWETEGKLAAEYAAGGHRRYDLSKLKPELYMVRFSQLNGSPLLSSFIYKCRIKGIDNHLISRNSLSPGSEKASRVVVSIV